MSNVVTNKLGNYLQARFVYLCKWGGCEIASQVTEFLSEGRNSMSAMLEIVGREAPTMEYLCRICGKREGEPQGWRLVIELDKPGTEIKNTLFIIDRWDENRAKDPHATCFCSIECESKYLAVRHQQLVA